MRFGQDARPFPVVSRAGIVEWARVRCSECPRLALICLDCFPARGDQSARSQMRRYTRAIGTRERIRRLKSSAAAKKMISPAWRWSRSSVAPNSSANVVLASEYKGDQRIHGAALRFAHPHVTIDPTMDRKPHSPHTTVGRPLTEAPRPRNRPAALDPLSDLPVWGRGQPQPRFSLGATCGERLQVISGP